MSGGVGFRISAAQRVALDRLAAERRCGISVLCREALEGYLATTTKDDQRCPLTN
jgi:hypothetical protein